MRLPRAWAAALGAALIASTAWAEEWFDAYERGREALKQGMATRAVESFERAIRLRPEPGTGLITYGTNRLDEYYPYLGLAEAQLAAGDPAAARQALQRSASRAREPVALRARLEELVGTAERTSLAAGVPPTLVATQPPASLVMAASPPLAPSPLASPAPSATPPLSTDPTEASPARQPPAEAPRPRREASLAPPITAAPATPPPAPPVSSLAARSSEALPERLGRAFDAPGPVGVGLLALAGLGIAAWVLRGRAGDAKRRPQVAPGADIETRAITRLAPVLPGAGERFGPYRLLETLGKGGMAAVFKAERNGEICALKRPLVAFLEDKEFLERFLREAELGRTLHHPNIVRIHERGDVEGTPYFTMELVQGQTLQALMRTEGALAPRLASQVVSQVAEALDYAHLKGVIHRDLKPSNIMILEGGTAKVMDYGIARAGRLEGLTLAGSFLGTPEYAAPEMARGEPSDARSDLYSLGVVFYEMVTARKPFVGDTAFLTLQKHCTEAPTAPSVFAAGIPVPLEHIILRLLSKHAADRYPAAEDLLVELRAFLNRF